MSRLKEQYQNEIVDAMIKKFGYKNIMEVPKLDKVVINMGVGEAKENAGQQLVLFNTSSYFAVRLKMLRLFVYSTPVTS